MNREGSLKIEAQITKKQRETQMMCKKTHQSIHATWQRHTKRRHYALNAAQNPKGHQQAENLSYSTIVMTRHDDHRIRGHLMGLTNPYIDEVKD